jgi:hypothetical protein
LPVSL